MTLTVWDFELPATPSAPTDYESMKAGIRRYYQERERRGKQKRPPDWNAVFAQCAQTLSDHRFTPEPGFDIRPVAEPNGSFRVPDQQIHALREFVDRYHANALSIVHPRNVVKDPDRQRAKLDAWLAGFDRAAKQLDRPEVLFYLWLKDEPNDREAYDYVRKWGRAIREAHSVVKVYVTEQPQPQENGKWGDLYGAVDIWCPLTALFEPEAAAKRQALGEIVWAYTVLCQGGKKNVWWQTDFPLVDLRATAWIMWRYRITGLAYWAGLVYWHEVDDPWTQPLNYYKHRGEGEAEHPATHPLDYQPKYNGEGMLVYPGPDVGYDGIAPSIRLKALRDSLEDYEYLVMLQRPGLSAEAQKIVQPLAESWFHWDANPEHYDRARAKLARLILEATPCKRARISR